MMELLYNHLDQNGVEAGKYNKIHKDHNFWQDFDEKTYIYATVRDPVFKTVSEFGYDINYDENGYKVGHQQKDFISPNFTIENFEKWFETRFEPNTQYKAFMKNSDDPGDLEKRLKRINLLIRSKNLKKNELNIMNKIVKDLNITNLIPSYNEDIEIEFYEEAIRDFYNYNIAGTAWFHKIKEVNNLDWKIYHSNYIQGL